MIHVFGDSWAYGYGLEHRERDCFGGLIGHHYGEPVKNYAIPASSMGHVTYEFMKQRHTFKQNDKVLVIIPPDVRWYRIEDGFATSLFNGMPLYEDWLEKHATLEWFIYNHSMFIHTLISASKQTNINLVLAHNYGNLKIHAHFENLIDTNFLLDKDKSLCYLLSGSEKWAGNYTISANNSMQEIQHPMFIVGDNHPNELGHKQIAELMIRKLDNELSTFN